MTATVQPLAAPAQVADLARRVEALDLDARTEAVLARMCGPVSPRVAALVDRMLPQVAGVPDYEVCLPLPVRVPGAALGDVPALQDDGLHCPSCESHDPRMHPATSGDEVTRICPDPWHTPQDDATAARILAAVAEVKRVPITLASQMVGPAVYCSVCRNLANAYIVGGIRVVVAGCNRHADEIEADMRNAASVTA